MKRLLQACWWLLSHLVLATIWCASMIVLVLVFALIWLMTLGDGHESVPAKDSDNR